MNNKIRKNQAVNNLIRKIIFVLLMTAFSPIHAAINIFACEPEWAALAEELGGEKLTTYSATTSMQDPHHIQARPSLIAKARRADLLVCSGAELETGWLPLLLRKSGNANIQPNQPGNFVAADYVEKLDVPKKLDRSMGDVHAEGNPHIHTNPENILLVADALRQRLAEIDVDNETHYASRYADFEKRWTKWVAEWKNAAPGATEPWMQEAAILSSTYRQSQALRILQTACGKSLFFHSCR